MKSKVDIANLALGRLGDKNSIEDIDNPTNQTENIINRWYDISRRSALRKMMPSFARARGLWHLAGHKPAFGYKYAYVYAPDCLKIIGIGEADESNTEYAVEGGYILTNIDYNGALPVRYVKDVTDVSCFDDNFTELFSLLLAYNIAPEVTESTSIINYLTNAIQAKISEVTAISGQENKPIIVKNSRLGLARRGLSYGVGKK